MKLFSKDILIHALTWTLSNIFGEEFNCRNAQSSFRYKISCFNIHQQHSNDMSSVSLTHLQIFWSLGQTTFITLGIFIKNFFVICQKNIILHKTNVRRKFDF